MKIEFLYPEVASLFGELGDIDFLIKSYPKAQIFKTKLIERPRFLNETIDFVFIGPMTERVQERVITSLMPDKDIVREKIESGLTMLAISNAVEIFGQYIETDDDKKIEALGIFPFYARRQMLDRLSDVFIGKRGELDIIGLKAQFTQVYKTDDLPYLCEVEKGFGLNLQSREEGICSNNFLGTYLLGPFLVSNPLFAKTWLEEQFPEETIELPFFDLAVSAYWKHLEDIRLMRP